MENNVILGVVFSKQQSTPPPGSNFGISTFIDLADGSFQLMAQCSADKLPKDGSLAAFALKKSRSGKVAVCTAWGWPSVSGKGSLNKKEGELIVRWVAEFAMSNASVSAGVEE